MSARLKVEGRSRVRELNRVGLRAMDREQEQILVRRFEDAVASLSVVSRTARHEQERASRIAINMRGHIR
jgi:hypothetical protein